MEGLIGVLYNKTDVELTFRDPPAAVIDVLEYAMFNELPIQIDSVMLRILGMNIQNETEDIDATAYGSINRTFLAGVRRRVIVHARPA